MKKIAVLFAFFLALAVVFTAPVSLAPHELAVNDGDPLHISWILAWDAHQLLRDPLHLFDSNTFHPYHDSLAFSEHLLVPALLAAPFYYATGNALLAQNLTVILTLAFSAMAMFLLVREVLGREDAGLVAGMVYVFHTYHYHEVARLQLLSVQWWPLAALFVHRLFTRGGRANGYLAGLFFLLQGLSCTYYLFYFALVLAFWIPAYALSRPGGPRRAAELVPPFILAGLVLLLFALPYQRMLSRFGYGRELVEGLDALEYVRPPDGSLLSRAIDFELESSVVPQFLGFLPLALAAIGLLSPPRGKGEPRRLFFWLSAATALVGFVLSLGPEIHAGGVPLAPGLYGLLYEQVPFFQVLRNPERMSVLVRFGLAVVSGWGAGVLVSRLSRPGAPLLRVLLLVLLPLEHFRGGQPFTRIPTGDAVPEVYRWLGEQPGGEPVVELPLYPRDKLRLHALYMFYSTYHWQPILFGRTSFYPPLTHYLAWELRRFPEPDTLELLRRAGVSRIVVRPGIWKPEERGEKLALLGRLAGELRPEGRFPALDGAFQRNYGFGDERVYRLLAGGDGEAPEALCQPEDEIDPAGWKLSGEGVTPLAWAVDRDPATKWKTRGQLPSLKLEIDLGREEIVSVVRLAIGHPYDQFPRDVTLKASEGARGPFGRVFHQDDLATKLELVSDLLENPSRAAVTLRFPPVKARRLRVWIREGKEFDYALPDWSLPELHVYRSCSRGFS